ncbi:MAG: uncharacterized protein PWQ96_2274 [Clostridia bacterium]|jgi:hypothetical protein|nr:phosphodiesterase, family [Clostridiales bacterium]MDK2986630.1 uncharacterized protein [Clostridia bacterium]
MKILLVSDTHGDIYSWKKMLELEGDADLIIHAGDVLYHGPRNPVKDTYNPAELAKAINEMDIPVLIAAGNCDAEVDGMVLNFPIQPSPLFCQVENKRIIVHHGHGKSEDELVQLAGKFKADMLVCGHTHLRMVKKVRDIVIVNPGSASLPKTEDQIPSFAVLDKGGISLVNLETGEVLEEES